MRKLLAVLVAVVAGWVAWQGAFRDRGQSLLFGRQWVDHWPGGGTDVVRFFFVNPKAAAGVRGTHSEWSGEWQRFLYEAKGDGQLELWNPVSKARQRLSYHAWRCDDDKRFDFCLDLTGDKGSRRYYSRRGWEIRGDGAQAEAAALHLLDDARR